MMKINLFKRDYFEHPVHLSVSKQNYHKIASEIKNVDFENIFFIFMAAFQYTFISFLMNDSFKTLKAYEKGYQLAMNIYIISAQFPKAETYSLTDQIRRSSRSVCANLAEAYRKRKYLRYFLSKLSDSDAECSETQVWLDFAKDCNYISEETYKELKLACEELGKLLGYMISHPDKFMEKANKKL